MAIADYEILKHTDCLAIDQYGWKGHSLVANFGDGYGAGINSGNTSGLRKWSLSAGALPDLDEYPVSYYLSGDQSDTRFDYFFEFFKRQVTTNNKPFYLTDYHTTDPITWLVSFQQPSIEFNVFAAQLFSQSGVIVQQRRVSDLTFNSDGSVDLSSLAPANLASDVITHFSISWDWDAVADSGAFNVTGYEVLLPGSIISDKQTATSYNLTGLDASTQYCLKVRTVYDTGMRSGWSSEVCDTTDATP